VKTNKLFLIIFFGVPSLIFGQKNAPIDTLPKALETVEISATRLSLTTIKAPLAVTILDKKRLQTGTQQLSPYEVLASVPGVFAMNPDNFSQDLRISIRGFGARSAFGIRGIRLFTDGLPEGTPDGQADVDNLDMGIIRQMEVLRGAASGLYGNAAGGVIYMLTENPTGLKPLLELQLSRGSFGFQRYQIKAGQKLNKWLYFVNGSVNNTTGYRAQSEMKNAIFNGKLGYEFKPNTQLLLLFNYGKSPTANDAGGLTALQIADNPRQAGAPNLLFETGEIVEQGRVGATFETKINAKHQFNARSFYTFRTLLNRLPVAANGYGDLKRKYYGVGFNYQFNEKIKRMPYRLKLGLDVENQADTRQRFAYLKETKTDGTVKYNQDKLVLNQLESFKSAGIYALQDLQITSKLLLSLGVRYDDLQLKATDNYLTDGNQSGSRHFTKVNPMAGVSYEYAEKMSVYANYSSTFESPTLNELSNNPDNSGGFNPILQPQQAKSVEIGTKGKFYPKNGFYTEGSSQIPDSKFQISNEGYFDVAVFRIETENDLVPYQIAGQTGKTYYRNAGKTVRKGIEIGVSYPIFKHLMVHYTHTFSDFKYANYSANAVVFDGKTLPAIPKSNAQIEARYAVNDGFFASVQYRYVSPIFANDANTVSTDAYSLLNLKIGHIFTIKDYQIEPFLGINNATNAHYVANILINAQNDRYFEPSSLRYFFGGLKLRIK
jgi:iron complex outermembrane recepter protein